MICNKSWKKFGQITQECISSNSSHVLWIIYLNALSNNQSSLSVSLLCKLLCIDTDYFAVNA